MPLKSGYSRETVAANRNELQRAGLSARAAYAVAQADARVAFFKRHPGGALPVSLAFPRGYRMREHYDANGKPLHFSRNYRVNPIENAQMRRVLQTGNSLYERFHGEQPRRITRMRIRSLGTVAVEIGQVTMIGYETIRDGQVRLYRHDFARHARPLLAASHDGRTVMLLGGAFTFTDRGIVDAKRQRKRSKR